MFKARLAAGAFVCRALGFVYVGVSFMIKIHSSQTEVADVGFGYVGHVLARVQRLFRSPLKPT